MSAPPFCGQRATASESSASPQGPELRTVGVRKAGLYGAFVGQLHPVSIAWWSFNAALASGVIGGRS